MIDSFETLIHQLGIRLGMNLRVDQHRACTIKTPLNLTVQIQLDSAQEQLLIASFITELPPGKFRENVLCEALKANGLPDPRTGVLGYLSNNNRLTLHQRYPIAFINGELLTIYVAGFIDYATLWRQAIEKGQTSPSPITQIPPTSPFR